MAEIFNYIAGNTVIPTFGELVEKNWLPLIKANVVSISSTGQLVWGMNATGSREVVEDNSALIQNSLIRVGAASHNPTFNNAYTLLADISGSSILNAAKRLKIVTAVSNAGGTLDADVDLVAALASYTAYFRVLNIWSDGAETPTWEIEDDDGLRLQVVSPAHVAGQVMYSLEGLVIDAGADLKKLYLDTTSANLGNVKTYRWLIEYWYET